MYIFVGITIISVGVGILNRRELEMMSSNPQTHVLVVRRFRDLDGVANKILHPLCRGEASPKETVK